MKSITNPRMVWEFFHDRMGLRESNDFRGVCHFRNEDAQTGTTADMDKVAVAVAYNNFVGRTCAMHVIVQNPGALIPPRIVREAFEYAFIDAGCEAVLGFVDSENDAVLRLKFGFKEIARIPHGGLEGDLIVLRMLRSECRWLRKH